MPVDRWGQITGVFQQGGVKMRFVRDFGAAIEKRASTFGAKRTGDTFGRRVFAILSAYRPFAIRVSDKRGHWAGGGASAAIAMAMPDPVMRAIQGEAQCAAKAMTRNVGHSSFSRNMDDPLSS